MSIQFPTPASQGDTFTASNGVIYTYDNGGWTANSSLNSGQLAGFRNQLINGDFQIIQRGTPVVGVDQAFQFDRWYQPGGTDGVTRGGNLGPDGITYFARCAAGSAARLAQYVELQKQGQPGVFALGSTWTISYFAKCASGTESMTAQTWWSDGAVIGGDPNISDSQIYPAQEIDTTWKRYSWTFTIGATGPNPTNNAFVAKVRSTSTSIGSEVLVTGVQLEPGPVATPFEHRPIGTELALCQRYYRTIGLRGTAFNLNGSTFASIPTGFPPGSMRATPTSPSATLTINQRANGSTNTAVNITSFANLIPSGYLRVDGESNTGATASDIWHVQTESIKLDAEL